jgi:membrane protein DedA with SNARE-associated domain
MADAVIQFITEQGYLGVFLLMAAENVFPPIPSEVILPFIGHSVAKGELSFYVALVVATLGALVGTLFWYLIGWFAPAEKLEQFFRKYGGYVAISAKDFHRATGFFVKYEVPAVLLGRMIPGVRSVISVPAGSVRMRPRTFLFYSIVGTMIWNTGLMTFGYLALNDYSMVEKYMSPIADGIIYTFIGIYIIQVIRFVLNKETEKQ